MCISKDNPLHGDEAVVFNAYAAQQTSGWGKSFPRANQAKPFSDCHDVVLVPVCWDHLHSPSSAALPATPSVNPLAASDNLGSAALPALQSMTPLTVSPGSSAMPTPALAQAAPAATATPPAPAAPATAAANLSVSAAPAASAEPTPANSAVKPAAPEAPAAPAEPEEPASIFAVCNGRGIQEFIGQSGYFCSVCYRSWLLKDTAKIPGGLCCGQRVVETDNLEVAIDGCGYSKPGCPVRRAVKSGCSANDPASVAASSSSAAASGSPNELASVAVTSDEPSTRIPGTPAEQARSEQDDNPREEKQEEEGKVLMQSASAKFSI